MVMASVLSSTKKQVMAAAKSGKGVLQVTAPPQPCECVHVFTLQPLVYMTVKLGVVVHIN